VIQPPHTHLAQLNVANLVDDIDAPRLKSFRAALDPINALAERSPGFVWRLKSDSGNATDINVADDKRFIVNMSVWETAEHLEQFVWNTVHARVYEKKGAWMTPMATPHLALWWVPIGHRPTTDEAMERLARLTAHGPSADVFGWESLPNVKLWLSKRCA